MGIGHTVGQMGMVRFKKKDFRQAVELNFIALAIFKYLESSQVNIMISNSQDIRKTIGEEKFDELSRDI